MQLHWTVLSNVVWRVQKISHVCLGVVSFPEGEHPRKNHLAGILLSSIVFSTASIAANSRCCEGLLLVSRLWLLWSLHSGSRWPSFWTRESYLLLLKDLELFEDSPSTDCLCMSRIEPPSMRPVFEVTEARNWLSIVWLGVERRVQRCATGYDICNCTSLSGIFSPSCVNERKMDAWEQHHHLYGSSQHAVFHLSIQWRMKSH